MDPLTVSIVGALLPTVSNAIGSIIERLTGGGGSLPKNVDEAIKLKQAQIDHLKAIAELDRPGEGVSTWVANLRASFRPILCLTAFAAAFTTPYLPGLPEWMTENIFDLATLTTTYIFGERMILGMKGLKK